MESESPNSCDSQEQASHARDTQSDLIVMDREVKQEMTEQKKLLTDVQSNLSNKIDDQKRELSEQLTKQLKEVKDHLQEIQRTTGNIERHMSSLRIPRKKCEVCTITQYSQKKKQYSIWLGSSPTAYSEPFYSHRYGYKFRLGIRYQYNGISPFLHLMEGEYDNELPWPMEVTVQLKLLNQAKEDDYVVITKNNTTKWKKDERDLVVFVDGFKMTYSHLERQSDGTQYVMDDCIKFEVQITTN